MQVTLLNGLYKTQKGHYDLSEVLQNIKTGVYTHAILKVRETLNFKGKRQYNEAKLSLPCFTPSGIFGQAWKTEGESKRPVPPTKRHILDYNGVVVLDYDNLEPMSLFDLQHQVTNCEYTLASFFSPSNKGYKVLVKTSNRNKAKHSQVFKQVRDFYKKLTDIEDDKSGSNINRLCFVSVDSQLHYNEDSKVFLFKSMDKENKKPKKTPVQTTESNSDSDETPMMKMKKALRRIESKGYEYVNGQRHEFVKQFSVECVKYGVTKSDCMTFVDTNLVSADCVTEKVLKVVEWAYSNVTEVGIYEEWVKDNSKPEQKETSNKKEGYEPELYKEKGEQEFIIRLPELDEEGILELDEKTRKAILYQKMIEKILGEHFDFRINVLKNREEYRLKSWTKYKEMDKIEYNSISRALQLHGVSCSPAKLESIILSHFSKQEHPLKVLFEQWSEKLGTNKTDYISKVADLIHTDAPKGLFHRLFRKWLVASVANVYVETQCTNHHCLILCGDQETNKTTFLSSLFSSEYVFTGHLDLRNKDTLISLTDTFIIVLDEQFSVLDKEKDWETLKSAVTMPRIKARWHYAKSSKLAPRIANFCGTTNRIEILQDDTGNRRFIPFQVTTPINVNKLRKIDLTKMWAQAYNLYKQGWKYLPTQNEKLEIESYQQKFKKLQTEHHIILNLYESCDDKDKEMQLVSSFEIWERLHRDYPKLDKNVTPNFVARAMKHLGFQQKNTHRDGGKRARYWVVKYANRN